MAAVKNVFVNISGSRQHRAFILTAILPFSGQRNPMLLVADVLIHLLQQFLQILTNFIRQIGH